ncbi:DUF1351 domain-containing protein [Hydrogenophaga sp. 2FB]|uniref:DUF1351 domain-containing protein n=1 Tax=Hydrogenophaga sp. 2FB TaxID=2502187 RepID=UPI0014859EFC|nr:DUF1351 domain-containing protein [Hydrogenophaga sp. 2FB]
MTTETPIDLIDRAEINAGGVLVQYSKTEAALAALREKYTGATFDMTTTKGDKEARAARLELTTLRTGLEKRRKEFKAPALEFGKKIDAEAARITAEIEALEQPIDAQIRADETRRAAEKAERERIEAERVAVHQNRLAVIRACVGKAQGLPSARIAVGIEQVERMVTDAATWEEFAGEAATAQAETLAAMRSMFDAAKAREDEEARVELQRVENERIAAENRAQAERLAEAQRELDAKAAAFQAEQDAIAARRAEEEAEAERKAQDAIKVAATPAVHTYENGAPMYSTTTFKDNGEPIMLTPEGKRSVFCDLNDDIELEKPTVKLGELNTRLGFIVTADFIESLGFTATVERNARLYRESDFPRICAAIVRHVQGVAQGVAA